MRCPRFAFALLCLAALSPAVAKETVERSAFKRFQIAGTPAPVYYYASHRIEDGSRCETAAVIIHGWGGGLALGRAEEPFATALANAVGPSNVAPYVIAPLFPRRRLIVKTGIKDDGRAIWNDSWGVDLSKHGLPDDDWRGGGDAAGMKLSSFEVVDSILLTLGDKNRYPALKRVLVTGFSAGGQFVGRYVAVGKGFVREGVEVRYAAMAPSTELRLDDDVIWHYGLKGRPRYSAQMTREQILKNLSSRRVWRACGTKDVLDKSLDVCPEAMKQGANRYVRFRSFEAYLKQFPTWAKQVSFHAIEGIGHKSVVAHTERAFIDYALGRTAAAESLPPGGCMTSDAEDPKPCRKTSAAAGGLQHDATLFDELMPRPVKVEAAATDETFVVPVAALGNVSVIQGQVPGAPAATADEAYILEIGSNGAKITASGPFGEIWARVTLDQLVRLSQDGRVPCGRIVDWPRLKWRGFMLDSVRNYLPPQGVKDIIDVMSRYKLNLFHWHLTENYAWRLESKRFPELQSKWAFLHRHKGKFYTQEEFSEIVDYAYVRGVRVMPEFDFPGHALAFRRAFGFKTMSDPGVAEKAAALFEELCTLAPKEKMPFIHMGTDEVFKREVEGAPRETLERMAKSIADGGRTMVSWVPGETYDCPGPRINMLWTNKVSPDKNPGAYFDAIGMYIEDFDPFELLSVAVYHKTARWHDAGDCNQGAIFCAWHDGFVGLPYENLLRNQPVFPSCVLFGDAYWHGRDNDLPQFRKSLPLGGDPLLAEAVDIERRTVAQRDRALRDLKHPFHFLRQTGMRWRLTQADGTLIAKDIAQATISPGLLKGADGQHLLSPSNGSVVAETWIKSPRDQSVGAWIGFTGISRDHGLVNSAPLPDMGEWNRFGAKAELNGEPIEPPRWKRPGLKKGKAIADWTPAWTLYEADEEPFTDREYFMREPTPIRLRRGWNHVRLTIPNPAEGGKTRHRWTGTFIPVEGATDHPREVQGLEYASVPPV